MSQIAGSSLTARLVLIPKNARILGAVFLASCMYFGAITLPYDVVPYALVVLGIGTYFLTYVAILEDIKRGEWYTLFYTPVLWTLVWYLFYFLTPVRWLTRLGSVAGYSFMLYILISINNIFNVAVSHGLPLHRAANKLNQLAVVVLLFIFFQVLFAFSGQWFINMMLSFVVILGISIQMYWGNHQQSETKVRIAYGPLSLLTTVILTFFVALFCFLPFISPISRSAILAGIMYVLSGLIFLFTQEKAYITYTREYILTAIVLMLILVLSVQW